MTLTYGSVCSGIEAATTAWHGLGWTPKFFSEIEKFPSAVLAHHYGSNMPGEPLATNGVPNHGDFTKIGTDAGPVDLLVGGTPCQSFSVAGKRLGLDDPRGNLALEFLALAGRLRARWIVWENVPGVLSSRSDDGTHDFATFLNFVRQCGYGFAYRVLDAQYVRTCEFPWAVPQRRRRVFLVGYLGDWRRAAAVLLEPEGMRGDPAPSRQAGKGIAAATAPSLVSSGRGVERAGETRGQDPVVAVAVADVASTLNAAFGSKQGLEDQHVNAGCPLYVAHALRGEGFDASEDGTGRGTPLVPVAIQERAISENPDAGPDGAGVRTDGAAYTLEARQTPQAVAFAQNQRGELRTSDVSPQLTTGGGKPGEGYPAVAFPWAVRRLTPMECERLQGFPDGYTDIPWRGKDHAPDGPRYKALGNSMAVNVMQWIGERIAMVEALADEIDKADAA